MTTNSITTAKPRTMMIVLALLMITIFWGSTFVFQKILLQHLSVPFIAFSRFFTAGLIFLLFFFNKIKKTFKKKPLINGTIIGSINGIALIIQLIGLKYTTASNSAFITATYVVFLPLIDLLVYKKKITIWVAISIVTALFGTYLLSSSDLTSFSFNKGDLITLGCGGLYALQIFFISHFTKEENIHTLVFSQFMASAFIGLLYFIFGGFLNNIDDLIAALSIKEVLINLFVMATFATFIPFSLQFYVQKHVSSTVAGMAYLAEPVFALILSVIILNEKLSIQSIGGILFIFSGILIISIKDKN